MTANTALIECRGLGRRFGDRDALIDVDLDIPAATCFGLFGHNGSGKTTLLKLIGGLIRATTGQLLVAGLPLPNRAIDVRRRISVLLDQPFVPRNFTLEEGLEYTADLYGLDVSAAARLELLERVGLEWQRRDPIRTFSRGMGQRASLACALLPDPEILILDEPFTGLDPNGCQLVEDVVAERVARGKSVLLVTHELDRGLRLASELVVFKRGRVVLASAADELDSGQLREVIG